MTATRALSELPEIILRRIVLTDASSLPGIVGSLSGNNVGGVRLLATVDGVEGVDLWEEGWDLEHGAALVLIVTCIKNVLQAEGVVIADLPPTELSAALRNPTVASRAPVSVVLDIAQALGGVVAVVVE